MKHRLEGAVVVVTGGASGIGRATSTMMAEAGAKVAIGDIHGEKAAETAEEIAGKTGTAQVATEDGYSDTKYVASFVGVAPADDPAIVVSIMVNQPQGAHTGGEVAAPGFGELASFALPYLGVPTDQ